MNKGLLLGVIVAFSMIAMASAVTTAPSRIDIHGLVYQGNVSNGVPDANVSVTCGSQSGTAVSGPVGQFFVILSSAQDCDIGSNFTAYASSGALSGSFSNTIRNDSETFVVDIPLLLGVGDAYIPLIPEFGFIAGTIAIAIMEKATMTPNNNPLFIKTN